MIHGNEEFGIKGLRASTEWLAECDARVVVYEPISYTLSEFEQGGIAKEVAAVEDGKATEYVPNSEKTMYSPTKVTENEEHRQHEAKPSYQLRRSDRDDLKFINTAPTSLMPYIDAVNKIAENNEKAGPGNNWIDKETNRSNKELELLSKEIVPLTINMGGRVWLDRITDGKRIEGEDEYLPGVEVILHNYTLEQKTGKEVIALTYNYEEKSYNYNKDAEDDKIKCITVTDKEGKYFFTELSPQYKYYVEFKYNGELYEPTYFTDNFEPDYSHATDTILIRKNFNETFETIDANNNYTVKRPIGMLDFEEGNTNKIYNLWKYSKDYTGTNDNSMKANNGIKEIYEELIEIIATYAHSTDISSQNFAYTTAIRSVLTKHYKDPEIKNKLQFIEDCKIENAYSGYHNGKDYNSDTTNINKGLYPPYTRFIIGNQTISLGRFTKKDMKPSSIPPAYPALLGIDFGLYERETGDLNITKSIINAEVTVNEKYQKYTYKDKTTVDFDVDGKEDAWEIEDRAADENYYKQEYTREIRPADYEVDNTEAGYSKDQSSDHYKRDQLSKARAEALGVKGEDEQELRIFITYKVKVKNQSSIIAIVPREINDYFDKSFKLAELNYEYTNNSLEDIEGNTTCSVDESGEKYNVLTIRDDTLIEPGASKDYMIKFEVLKTNDTTNEMLNRIILGQKENLVEVMKYSTYYINDYEIPDYTERDQCTKRPVSAEKREGKVGKQLS